MSTYQCKKCGKVSSKKKDICATSKEISSFYICDTCNKQSVSIESICRPREVAPAYYCKKCGSSDGEKGSLCEPKAV
ncbi:MAG: hypothetical protein GY710_08985 [Desulfobacteraceae bacterium]|nr:hypothetical protein [Desulfobacteraceae bacterium]